MLGLRARGYYRSMLTARADLQSGMIETLLPLFRPDALPTDARLSEGGRSWSSSKGLPSKVISPCARSHAPSSCRFWMAVFHLLASAAFEASVRKMAPLTLSSMAASLAEIDRTALRAGAHEWAHATEDDHMAPGIARRRGARTREGWSVSALLTLRARSSAASSR